MTRKSRRGDKPFEPNSDFIQDAVSQFLKTGGRITRYAEQDEEFEHFIRGGAYRPNPSSSGHSLS